ncbi:hypothetical protein Mapa_003224 [Marchantia paleacea]|nr:hypothetical protein Mapa_003224 [Marchantia paleacea]
MNASGKMHQPSDNTRRWVRGPPREKAEKQNKKPPPLPTLSGFPTNSPPSSQQTTVGTTRQKATENRINPSSARHEPELHQHNLPPLLIPSSRSNSPLRDLSDNPQNSGKGECFAKFADERR